MVHKHIILKFLLIVLLGYSPLGLAWNSDRLGTPIVINDLIIPYPTFSMFFLPSQTFTVHFKDALNSGNLEFNGQTVAVGNASLTAPDKPGLYPLIINNSYGKEQATISIFVLTPASQIDKNGKLNGYTIGSYPLKPLNNNPIYLPPKGFIEVTQANYKYQISPNFTLGQFVSKQAQGYPKYLFLRAGLLLKLENILATLNRKGLPTEGFVIMSGYRTPWYNKAIGNVPYSRHVWGGAADIYIDQDPQDGRMDDLNNDGKSNREDAVWLANFINTMSRRGDFGNRIGGLGIYGSNSAHGPFVHVDVRGKRARW